MVRALLPMKQSLKIVHLISFSTQVKMTLELVETGKLVSKSMVHMREHMGEARMGCECLWGAMVVSCYCYIQNSHVQIVKQKNLVLATRNIAGGGLMHSIYQGIHQYHSEFFQGGLSRSLRMQELAINAIFEVYSSIIAVHHIHIILRRGCHQIERN